MGQIQQAASGLAQTALGAAVAGKHLKQQQEQINETKELKQQQLEAEAVTLPVKEAEALTRAATLENAKAQEEFEKADSEANKALKETEELTKHQRNLDEEYRKVQDNKDMDQMDKLLRTLDINDEKSMTQKAWDEAAGKFWEKAQSQQEAKERAKKTALEMAEKARKQRDVEIKANKLSAEMASKRLKLVTDKLEGGKK